jgi:hypothetical protein
MHDYADSQRKIKSLKALQVESKKRTLKFFSNLPNIMAEGEL